MLESPTPKGRFGALQDNSIKEKSLNHWLDRNIRSHFSMLFLTVRLGRIFCGVRYVYGLTINARVCVHVCEVFNDSFPHSSGARLDFKVFRSSFGFHRWLKALSLPTKFHLFSYRIKSVSFWLTSRKAKVPRRTEGALRWEKKNIFFQKKIKKKDLFAVKKIKNLSALLLKVGR